MSISGRQLFEYSLFLHKMIAKKYGRFIRVDTVGLEDRDPRSAVLELMSREILRYGIDVIDLYIHCLSPKVRYLAAESPPGDP